MPEAVVAYLKVNQMKSLFRTVYFPERVARALFGYAYELAKFHNKTLTSISRADALNYSMVFWYQISEEIGKEYPDVKTYSYLVDAVSMFMVKDPKRFEVVVTSNLFGDILTDFWGAAIAGGMSLAAGAKLNTQREFPSMFEPIHGVDPDIAGKGIANPPATVWSSSQMLYFFGHSKWAEKLIDCIEELLVENKLLTPDHGGTATTEMYDEILKKLIKNAL